MHALGDAIGGADAVRPGFERDLFSDALKADASVAERARTFTAATWAVHDRAGRLFEVLAQAAQTDPDLQSQREEIKARRLELVRGLVRASGRRRGSGFERVVDLIYVLSSTSLHNEFVSRGWTSEAYQDWLSDAITRLLEDR